MSTSKKDTNNQAFQTPMMQQYLELKKKYPDCLLFFRLGDFYELFLEDAKIGAHILGITLTRRSRGKDGEIPMCGVPYHSVDLYIPKLVEAGQKIAIAEQITSPKETPNLVVREVVRIITAGTMIEGRNTNERESCYVAAVLLTKTQANVALADIATGDFFVVSTETAQLADIFHRYRPKEVILSPKQYNTPATLTIVQQTGHLNISPFSEWDEWSQRAEKALLNHFSVRSLRGFGLEGESEIQTAAVLLGYLSYTQHGQIQHLKTLKKVETEQRLYLDAATLESLEIFQSSMDKTEAGSLLSVLDETKTSMGARMLREWLAHPLADKKKIEARQRDVEFFREHKVLLTEVRELLDQITDIERHMSKLSVNIGNARDVVGLRESLKLAQQVFTQLKEMSVVETFINESAAQIAALITYLDQWIEDDPPGITKIGKMIKPGVHTELDQLRTVYSGASEWLTEFEKKERSRTGITTLKVDYNSVFGFYIEVSKAHTALVHDQLGYVRKQTLVNAERFITPDLKRQEEIVLSAQERVVELEYELFVQVTQQVLSQTIKLQTLAKLLAYLDCVATFAQLSLEREYVQPQMVSAKKLTIVNGRHPVVERFLEHSFVPNSTALSPEERMLLITGPNMAGKSTYIRQVALIVLMAHIGCYVPAEKATIGVTDRIFSRIGASDALHKGLSTFMVEMTETAKILHHLTDRSLVIVDEIGRGTGTSDGMSIAQAIAEYLVTHPSQPFVFFATHFHELADLANDFPGIANYAMAVQFQAGKLHFLRTIQRGSTQESFGVEVAQQAGLPGSVVKRAELLRRHLKYHLQHLNAETIPQQPDQMHSMMASLNLEALSPKEALDLLYEWSRTLKKSLPKK